MNSPLRAEVYFINMKVFTNLKWGTRDPVAFKDEQLGLIRLRAFGMFQCAGSSAGSVYQPHGGDPGRFLPPRPLKIILNLVDCVAVQRFHGGEDRFDFKPSGKI